MSTSDPVTRPLVRALLISGALALAAGTVWAGELVLRPSATAFGERADANVVLVRLHNETELQGLQFRIDYDPAVARPVAVTALERLGDPNRLQYRIEPGTVRALVCDLTSACASIAPGDGPIVSVAFALANGPRPESFRITLRDALEVTGSLVASDVAGMQIAIPIARSAPSAERPVGATDLGRANGAGDLPAQFAIHPVGPNPFSSGTTLRLDVPRSTQVRVAVYDTRGRLVRVLADRFMEAGRHAVDWDGATDNGSRAGAGLFFVRGSADGVVFNRKIIALQ